MTRRFRGPAWLVVVGLVGVGTMVYAIALFVGGAPALSGLVTRFVVVDDELEPADIIYVLNGAYEARVRRAAQLYREGMAPKVILAETREGLPARPDRRETTLGELVASAIVALSVPESAVVIIPFERGVVDTYDEARALREYLDQSPARSVIVVTTDYHTGRARRAMRQALRGLSVQVRMAAVPSQAGFTPENWWESKEGIRVYMDEFLKQVATLLHIRRQWFVLSVAEMMD